MACMMSSLNSYCQEDIFGGTQTKWIASKQLLDKSLNILELRKINESEYVCLSNRRFGEYNEFYRRRFFFDRIIKKIPYTSNQDIDNLKELMNNHVPVNP